MPPRPVRPPRGTYNRQVQHIQWSESDKRNARQIVRTFCFQYGESIMENIVNDSVSPVKALQV